MPEYIEREAAIKFVEEQMKEINNKTIRIGSYVTEAYDMAIRHAVGFLRYVPTAYPKANTVEVVRCKDCKFLQYGECRVLGIKAGGCFYCYLGERKEE